MGPGYKYNGDRGGSSISKRTKFRGWFPEAVGSAGDGAGSEEMAVEPGETTPLSSVGMRTNGDVDGAPDRPRHASSPDGVSGRSRYSGWARAAAIVFCLVFAGHHLAAVFLESINWDEFALMYRTRAVVLTNTFETGGRPGLAMFLLMSFVGSCTDVLDAALHARLWWMPFGLGYPAMLFLLLREFLSRSSHASARSAKNWDALLGVGLLVLVPLWLRWSVQVRTDQPALFLVLASGVLMMRSERVVLLALLAGASAGLGCLFTQKGFYIGVLVAAVVAGHAWLGSRWVLRRDLARASLFALAWGIVYLAFRTTVLSLYQPGRGFNLEGGLDHFEHYRKVLDFGLYPYLAPFLVPHALLVLGLCAASVQAMRRKLGSYRELVVAWTVLVGGALIARFHATSFAYFWMTIGVFPAAAGAIAMAPIRELLAERPGWLLPSLHGAGWLILIGQSLSTADSVLDDTLSVQQSSLDFVARNFSPNAAGFHPEGALTCRSNQGQSRTWFSIHIAMRLHGRKNTRNVSKFIDEFREKPVEFIVPSFRLFEFPPAIRRFWETHYVRYSAGVMVPGYLLAAGRAKVDVIVPGRYRWLPAGPGSESLSVEKAMVSPGASVELGRGSHGVEAFGPGLLVRALRDAPTPSPRSFYSVGSIQELAPRRR